MNTGEVIYILRTTMVHHALFIGQVQTLFRTDKHKIIYPVQDRAVKYHTLSSGMSPYRPHKGVQTPGSFVISAAHPFPKYL